VIDDPVKEAYAQALEDAVAELKAWAREVATYTSAAQVSGVEESARIIARRAYAFRKASVANAVSEEGK